jgi:hypothetical protein
MVFHPDELQMCAKHVDGESATDSSATKTERNISLMTALEALALTLGVKAKKKGVVLNQLTLLRKTPAQVETHMQQERDRSSLKNPKRNLKTSLKKEADHITYMNETALVNPSRLSDTQVHLVVLYYAVYRKAVD